VLRSRAWRALGGAGQALEGVPIELLDARELDPFWMEPTSTTLPGLLGGAKVTEVAGSIGVSRQTLHTWVTRYLLEGVAGLADRSHRPQSGSHETPETVGVKVAELRRQHPRWGAKRIRMELLKAPVDGETIPATATINRILIKLGLVTPRKRKRPKDSYRWERPGAKYGLANARHLAVEVMRIAGLEAVEQLTRYGDDDHRR
jgi:transposase